MTEPTLPEDWKQLLIEQRRAKLRQAEAVEREAKALREEAATLGKMAGLDKQAKSH
jgi:hypothetical protein